MYGCEINADNSFTITDQGVPIYTSRPFRLRSQAEQKAKEWMDLHIGKVPQDSGVTLVVQNLSVDANTLLFGKRR